MGVPPFINIIVDFQPVIGSSTGHELPKAFCTHRGNRMRVKGRLDYGKVFKLLWHAVLSQKRFYRWKIKYCSACNKLGLPGFPAVKVAPDVGTYNTVIL